MIFGQTKLELKIGVFVFIGLIILIMFVLLIGDFKTWTSGYQVNFVFNFVNGIKIGAPVRFAGVDVGEVKDIEFIFRPEESKTKVVIIAWLKKSIKIPLDSEVWVNTLGLLGEKYIEIIPGKDYNRCADQKQSLTGIDPIPMHEVARLAKDVASAISESFGMLKRGEGTLGKLFYDDTLYKDLEAILRNKEGTVGRLFYDDTLYNELEAFIVDIRKHPWKLFHKTKEGPKDKK